MKRKLLLLVVDDSTIIIERMLPILLEIPSVGEVMVAYNYDEGRKILEEKPIDLAILDINLPGKSGIDLLRFAKDKRHHSPIVIMMSDDPAPEKKEICIALKADYYFNKFIGYEVIPEIIATIKPLDF